MSRPSTSAPVVASTAPATTTPLALAYLRVSTTKQAKRGGEAEGFSIPAQRTAVLRKASELGAVVPADGEYIDAGESARSADRPALQAMLARLLDRSLPKVAYVIVHKVDRLARDRADDVAIGLAIHKAGAVLVSATEAIDDSPAGTLLHGIMASIAEFYSKNLAMEVKKGQTEKARRGGTPGYVPLGYNNVITKDSGQEVRGVVVDAERAPLVQWAFSAYASGEYSIVELLEEVTARGLTNRPTATRSGKPLTRSQLHRMLSSRYYVGKVFWSGIEYDGQHKALIDLSTFAAVQAMLGSRRLAGDRSWKHDHYLKGSLRCERCGSRIAYGISTGKSGGKYPYFFCLGRAKKRTDCNLPSLSVDEVEQKVAEHWQDVAMPTEMAERVRTIVTEMIEEQAASGAALLKSQATRLAKLERTRQKLIDAYLAEAISTTDLKARQEALASEQHDAERLLQLASQNKEVLDRQLDESLRLLTHCAELYVRVDDERKRSMNQVFFQAIFIDEHGVGHVDLNAPFRTLRSVGEDAGGDGHDDTTTTGDSGIEPTDGPDEPRGGTRPTGTRQHRPLSTRTRSGNKNTASALRPQRCSNLTVLAVFFD